MPDPKLSWQDLAASYAWSASLIKSDPSLLSLFKDAVAKGWDANTFQAKLTGTKWFKTHAAPWRKAKALQASDPKTWQSQVDQQTQAVLDAATAMGSNVSGAQAKKMATNMLMFGWDQHQIQNQLASFVTENKGTAHWGGEAGQTEMKIRQTAQANGVKMDQAGVTKWVKAIARGDSSIEDADGWIRTQAQLAFPQYAAHIKAGMNVDQLASPFIQSMSNILEVSPDSVDLYDKNIRSALTHTDAKGQPAQLSLTEFENSLRADPRWKTTKNARDSAASTTLKVLSDFGFKTAS